MPRKKSGKTRNRSPQLVVRIPETLERDLLLAAEGLGLDQSNLVRMILTEHVGEYIERGRTARELTTAARSKKKPKPGRPPGDDATGDGSPKPTDDPAGGAQQRGIDL